VDHPTSGTPPALQSAEQDLDLDLYRTVKLFEDAGIIERHDFREGRARYEQMPDSHHDHLINLRDGKVIGFASERSEIAGRDRPASSATNWSITGSNYIACRWTTTNPDSCRHSGARDSA
jgi:Fe2+ or Zn2+ uptake regulation protein